MSDIRWLVKTVVKSKPVLYHGSPMIGSKPRQVRTQVKTLQVRINGKWIDVPSVKEKESP